MGFKYLILLEIFLNFYSCAPLLRSSYKPGRPESQKLEVKFTRNGGPINIETDKHLDGIFSSHPAFAVNHTTLKDSSNKKKQLANSSPMFEPDPPVLHPPAEPIVIEKSYTVREIIEPEVIPQINDYVAFVPPFQKNEGVTDPILDVVKSIQGTVYKPQGNGSPDQAEVYQNLKLLEQDLHEALEQSNNQAPIEMSPRTVKMIMSYLEHVDYMHKVQQGQPVDEKPELPDWYYEPPPVENTVEMTDLNSFLSDDIKARLEEIHKEIDDINQTLENYRKSGGSPDKIEELIGEKNERLEKIDRLELGMSEEKQEKLTQELDQLEQQEEQMRADNSDDSSLSQIEKQEEEIMIERDENKEEIAAIQLRGLKNRLLQVQTELSVVSGHDVANSQIDELEALKQNILEQEAEIVDKIDSERLEILENELKSINEKIELIENEENTSHQLHQLEHTKQAIIIQEDNIRNQLQEPTQDATKEILMDFENTSKMNAVLHAVPFSPYENSVQVNYHGVNVHQTKIDLDGSSHSTKNNPNNYNQQLDSQLRAAQPKQQQSLLRTSGYTAVPPKVTAAELLKDPLDLKFCNIDNYAKLDHVKGQLDILLAMYTVSFSTVPNDSELQNSQTPDLHANMKLLQEIRTAGQVFDKYAEEIDSELYFLGEELSDLNLSLEGMLSFYDLKDEYNATIPPETSKNADYYQHRMKLEIQVQTYKAQINQTIRDTNTLATLNKFLKSQFELLELKKADSGIDEVKKVDIVPVATKKINVVRNEIKTILNEMKNNLINVENDRKTVNKLIEDLNVMSKSASMVNLTDSSKGLKRSYLTGAFAVLVAVIVGF